MKKLLRFSVILICSSMLLSSISCASIRPVQHDQGKHKGWYKNPHNPHNPKTTKENKQTPGKATKIKIKIK